MYDRLAILALFVSFYSLIAGRLERTVISGPIIFVSAGLLIGPLGLGWFDEDVSGINFRIFADLTLAVILFIDAANVDFSILQSKFWIPVRMLLFGLPVTYWYWGEYEFKTISQLVWPSWISLYCLLNNRT
jgi:NhaP-type Na+/H+ or K+/H+ antiporter